MNVLAISGSLRAASLNSALLRATVRLAPADVAVTIFAGVGKLPLYNPDLESAVPLAVSALRRAIADADAILIASPEYAHGVSGSMKNLLDWLVSFEPFVHKPVAVMNASPRAHHADDALRETLLTMSAILVEDACISLPLLGSCSGEHDIVASPGLSQALRRALSALGEQVARLKSGASD